MRFCLALARHVGVLHAVEDHHLPVDALVGTSSGALVGALWSAGWSAERIGAERQEVRPLTLMGLHWAPWQGAFSLEPLIAWLDARLPPTFADLPRPFGVGVVGGDGQPRLVREGPLARAIAGSCAMPYVFAAVALGQERVRDGGAADRLMLGPWRHWRGDRPVLIHLVERTAGK